MQTKINEISLGRILIAAIISLLGICSTAFSEENIEMNFTKTNSADFSGRYEVTGLLPDSTTYAGSVQLEKWHTFTTPMGNVLQSFKMDYRFGDVKYNGVTVFDGSRLYFACGIGNNDNYYLLVLSKLEFSKEAHSSLFEYHEAKRAAKKGRYIEWKGDTPWYGYLDIGSQAYGYWFWIDGAWGQYSTRRNGFPPTADSGSFFMMELKENGEFGKERDGGFPEGYWEAGSYNVEPIAENMLIEVSWLKSGGGKNSAWGTGMMTTHPVTEDSILVAMIGGPDNTSFGWFEISGHQLIGTYSWHNGYARGTELWAVPEDVIKKNPAWFK